MSVDIHTEVQEQPEPVEAESELAPQEAAAEEKPAEKADEDHVEGLVDVNTGETHVTKDKFVSAVVSERRKRQEAEAERDTLREKAAQADQLAAYVNDARPYIDFLKANPDLLKPREAAPAPKAPADDTEAVAYAKRFQLYAADGTPDAPTARAILDDHRRIAAEEAQKAVKPYAQQTREQQAAGNLQRIREQKDATGNAVSDEALNATAGLLISQMGRDNALALFADPGNASVIAAIAHGLQAMTPKKAAPKAPDAAPLETEQAGGGSEIRVSDASLRVTGLAEGKYREAAKRWKPGQTNALE